MRHGPIGFAVARILRIYPGLVVCVLLSVFVLGPVFTTLPLTEYFSDPITWQHLLTATLERAYWYLPGVFENHPFSTGINGSLWSLPVEVRCYAALLVLGLIGMLRVRAATNLVMIALLLIGALFPEWLAPLGWRSPWLRPAAYFILGVMTWANRNRLPLHPALALVAIIAPIIAAQAAPASFHFVFAPCLVYLTFYAAYALPHVDLDRFGDVSYGVYIYAWPVQQMIIWPGQNGYENAAIAAPLTLALACASWFFVEKPALSFRRATPFRRRSTA